MILNIVKNPRHPEFAEAIVQVTMTRDQFAHLRDCVTLAYQSAQEGSRMVTIARMMRRDFDGLAVDLERIDAGNGVRAANAPGAAPASACTSPSRNYTYVECRECARYGTPKCPHKRKHWGPSVVPGCMIPVECAGDYRKAKEKENV